MHRIDNVIDMVVDFFDKEFATHVSIPTKPVPASRPRVTRWGSYYGKNYSQWRKEAGELLEKAFAIEFSGPLFVITEVICPKPKTTKRYFPRGDNDNYEKAIWDSITQSDTGWHDDDQIVMNLTYKRFAEPTETPGVKVTIYQLTVET